MERGWMSRARAVVVDGMSKTLGKLGCSGVAIASWDGERCAQAQCRLCVGALGAAVEAEQRAAMERQRA